MAANLSRMRTGISMGTIQRMVMVNTATGGGGAGAERRAVRASAAVHRHRDSFHNIHRWATRRGADTEGVRPIVNEVNGVKPLTVDAARAEPSIRTPERSRPTVVTDSAQRLLVAWGRSNARAFPNRPSSTRSTTEGRERCASRIHFAEAAALQRADRNAMPCLN